MVGYQTGCKPDMCCFSSLVCIVDGDDYEELDDMDGFTIGGTVVNNHRYVDDTVIIVKSEEQLQRLINLVVTKSEEKGLYLNSAKSFAMVFSNASQIPTCNINVHGKILEQIHSFVSSPQMQDVRRRL